MNSAPGIPFDCGDQQPFRARGKLPGQVQHIHVTVVVGVLGKPGAPVTGQSGPTGSPGISGSGPAGPRPGLAGAVVTVMHLQGWVMGWRRPAGPVRARRPAQRVMRRR